MRITLYTIAISLLMSCGVSNLAAQKKSSGTFAMSMKQLQENKASLNAGNKTLEPAVKKLLREADKALVFGPVSVMEKTVDPPSGDKHDYTSLAPYWWPDSSKPNGLPYIRRDGVTNPEVKNFKDKDYMPTLCKNVETLGLAYFYSGDEKYAQHAAKLLRTWFLDPATAMNPNLNFAQAIKGRNDGRGAGLIDSRHFIVMIDGIQLIKNSSSWTKTDQAGMQKWAAAFLTWMQTSPVGLDELDAPNNHGAFYDAQRLSLALYVDSIDLAKKIVASAAKRLDYQMDEKGSFPKEMERTISLHYTAFVLEAFFNIAQMSEAVGVDFWNMITPSGKSLKKGFEAVKPYLKKPETWTGQQIKPFDVKYAYMLLLMADKHFKCKDCTAITMELAGNKGNTLDDLLKY